MIEFTIQPINTIRIKSQVVNIFETAGGNIDEKTVTSFGEEWLKFNTFNDEEIRRAGNEYFDIVPDEYFVEKSVLDMGCGTGRWTKYVSQKAASIDAVDPSQAIFAAANLLQDCANVRLSQVAVDHLPFADDSFDFVFSLGVLHHIPDTTQAMQKCVNKLKPDGYFLVYLYYNMDNRNVFFKTLFYLSNIVRLGISKLPGKLKRFFCDILAIVIYVPFVFLSIILESIGLKKIIKHIPLSYYRNKSFTIIRNDSLDRFGTPLEQRFSKETIENMMLNCGLTDIVFSSNEPYWHAIARKK
jgi:2-polyprenyl-3-methyl-5-hydroxy-6-metoxy-1,4-benzoquinol methylase